MDRILKEIHEGKYVQEPPKKTQIENISNLFEELPKRSETERKKAWYKIGKVLIRKHKIALHSESKVGARRTYRYYSINK